MNKSMPPLSRLRPFEAAARFENFSRAAEELGMTQTAVSKQIGQLESELGTALFERRNRAVYLTEAGQRLGRVVGKALSDIAAEMDYLRGGGRPHELVLHAQLCEAFYWLMPRLADFHARNPGIELRVISALKPFTEATEPFDVAIQTAGRPSGTARVAFTASDLIFPVCAPTLFDAARLPVTPTELARHPLLSHRVVPQAWMDWPQWFENVGATFPSDARVISFDSYPVALQAAASGQGIALGWQRTVESMLEEGKLIRPCDRAVPRPAEIVVYRGSQRSLHPHTDRLLSWLADQLSD